MDKRRMHDVSGRPLVEQLFAHEIHVRCHVTENLAVGIAEVVEVAVAVGRGEEAVLGATAIADEVPFAGVALGWQGIVLSLAEGLLASAVHHGREAVVVNVS